MLTSTEGVGDLRVIGLVPFMKKGNETLLVSFGFRAPTGFWGPREEH